MTDFLKALESGIRAGWAQFRRVRALARQRRSLPDFPTI